MDSSTTISAFSTLCPGTLTDALLIVIFGFIIAFILSFFIGANDVANSFGTSYGAKALTLYQICILGSIFETLGAILLGARVSETIRSGIVDVNLYDGEEIILMLGQLSALISSAIWLLIATALRLPVSGTHSIVGAIIGYHVVVFGGEGIKWWELGKIIISWFSSPVLSGIASIFFFFILQKFVLCKDDPLEPGLKSLPIWYSLVIVVNFFSIFYNTSGLLGGMPLYGVFLISFGGGLLAGAIVACFLVPYMRKKIHEMLPILITAQQTESIDVTDAYRKYDCDSQDKEMNGEKEQNLKATSSEQLEDHPVIVQLCSPLLILSAIFSAFAHGGNDVR
ncbi:sodium-dependent phosphate transporter 1-A-like [Anneissia japonica]|uniref:sodium-dependent phosphate transporter 1-A-like n=1 Tax=Anneissia japonica TaxID=1529436 RepID=UPI001425AE65|nr:sodium-dependent phosphate transporter 1-A-like [Anneissia japonica]XP_033121464.1 sodium-dependent phosphate transporter 1-A-like [Anneissia japonica]XP_033121465.1 sodium-dependent phosphate transporter 1-A-like [Anneissia japonica]XP_033121466.1 sodium-dependent phosphate transporter 1-A-like [Anneissia japonica]